MRRLAYTTYLVAQCTKLAQPDELAGYLHGAADRIPLPEETWQILQTQPEMSQTAIFADISRTAELLESMPESNLARLTDIFSLHHSNGVFGKIARNPTWILESVPIEQLEVGYMEPSLKAVISDCKHDLMRVAADTNVLVHRNFNSRSLTVEIPYDVLLATRKRGKRPRLIDGNHRAIHRARQILDGQRVAPSISVVIGSR